jgi:uncharacterized membrane protein
MKKVLKKYYDFLVLSKLLVEIGFGPGYLFNFGLKCRDACFYEGVVFVILVIIWQ